MQLLDFFALRHDLRIGRRLERAGCGNDVVCLDDAIGSRHPEAGTPLMPFHLPNFHAGTDRRLQHGGVALEILGHALFRRKGLRRNALEFHPGKTVMPGRSIRDQRIPTFRAPAFCDSAAFQHDMLHTHVREMLTHRDARLASTDHHGVDFFH
ncbi:hypothetical protein D3C72_1774090 [compost metagenome]